VPPPGRRAFGLWRCTLASQSVQMNMGYRYARGGLTDLIVTVVLVTSHTPYVGLDHSRSRMACMVATTRGHRA